MPLQGLKQETHRLIALKRMRIDSLKNDSQIDSFLRLSSQALRLPMVSLTCVDAHVEWMLGSHGFVPPLPGSLPRHDSLADRVVRSGELTLIPELQSDPHLADNPACAQARSFVGVPVPFPDGEIMTVLCAFTPKGSEPLHLADADRALLSQLATQAGVLLHSRKLKHEVEQAENELQVAFSGLIRAHSRLLGQEDQLAHLAKMASLGEMASTIVHEINNPLGTLQLTIETLKDMARTGEAKPPAVIDTCTVVESIISRISQIIRSTRSMARRDDTDPFLCVPFEQIIDETLEICAKKLRSLEIAFSRPSVPPKTNIECRRGQISQVILNLIINAIDAVEAAAQAGKREKWIRVDVKVSGENVEIAVEDSGAGVPEALREQIFLGFFSTKAPDQGTGLGLLTSKRIVAAHQGSLRLDTTAPHTRFVVSLPMHQYRR